MKTVLITGANKGIGFETAKQLARHGYFVYIGSRNDGYGAEAVKSLNDLKLFNIDYIKIDVSDVNSVRKARLELETKINLLDVLVNNAGIAGEQPQYLATGDIENLRNIFDTNFFGTIQTTQEFLPLLKKAKHAAIINVSSEVGSLAIHSAPEVNPNRAKYHAYGTSKAALNAFSIMLANELKESGISVNSITPGYTATDFNQFQGAKTVEYGANAIVHHILNTNSTITAKFLQEGGEVPW